MKSLTYITIIAALLFGFAPTEASASITSPDNEARTGKVEMKYSEVNESLSLKIYAPGTQERVRIIIYNPKNQVVHVEDVLVDRRGTEVKIPMHGLELGMYITTVQGSNIDFRDRFEKH